LAISLSGCEEKDSMIWIRSLPPSGWDSDSSLNYSFFISESGEKRDLLYQVQYSPNYSFENIWLKYWLIGPKSDTLIQSRDNLFLFQPKTGIPLGTGTHLRLFLDAYFLKAVVFKDTGLYQLNVKHYMRKKDLTGIQSLGLKIKSRD
jgi:gliding motility-associated lipoprotein GldH